MTLIHWLNSIDTDPETIDTDSLVATFVAMDPERMWSLTDVLIGLRQRRELEDLHDAVNTLVSDGFLEAVVYLAYCETDCDGFCESCRDVLSGDMLFRIPAGAMNAGHDKQGGR